MNIVVAIPSADIMFADAALCINAACIYTLQQQIQIGAIINKKGSIIHQARCALVDDAVKHGGTHILFLDSDHIIPKDAIVRLAKADKDIIGLHQVTKRPPCRSNCEDLSGKRLTKMGAGIEEVSRIGTGIMLINLNVFKNMKRPYFNFRYDANMFRDKGWIGEDYYFCEAARHKGYKIYVDHDLSKECYHIGTATYGVQELERTDGNENVNK